MSGLRRNKKRLPRNDAGPVEHVWIYEDGKLIFSLCPFSQVPAPIWYTLLCVALIFELAILDYPLPNLDGKSDFFFARSSKWR